MCKFWEIFFAPDSISGNGRNLFNPNHILGNDETLLLGGFEFHGDDSTEESREGVVTTALGLGGVGIVVR